MNSIDHDRKKWSYRFLEGLIGYTAIGFLLLLLVLSFVNPTLASLFLIVYSFLWVLKLSLNASYTIYSYAQVRRWETFDWPLFFSYFPGNSEKAVEQLEKFKQKYTKKIDWTQKIETDIELLKNAQKTKFADPNEIIQVNIFSVYNESADVLLRSLKKIYSSEYSLNKLVVFVSQEARQGKKFNDSVRNLVKKSNWVEAHNVSESDLEIVYSTGHYKNSEDTSSEKKNKNSIENYFSSQFARIKLNSEKLTVIFTQHPDGLAGEVKGKASNEDWAGRQASLFVKSQGIDPELVIATSLDADSHIGKYFYHNLSYRFCLETDRLTNGFQPVHVYSNNFFQTGLWPRQVATQTTLHNMGQLAISGQTPLFAIYSVPLVVLQQVDFWVREVIAEDSMLHMKCVAFFGGKFNVVPFYGVFEGDAVEADDYFEAIANQYSQLQRWAWGGVEGFPYMFKRFFLDKSGHDIDLRVRFKWIFLTFTNHFFWSTTPLLFSVGVLLPQIVTSYDFRDTQIAYNLSVFSQYFAWMSFVFLAIFSYITIVYIGGKAMKNADVKWYHWLLIGVQCAVSPLIYVAMGIPGIDAQLRGIFGKYLAYVVTPKK